MPLDKETKPSNLDAHQTSIVKKKLVEWYPPKTTRELTLDLFARLNQLSAVIWKINKSDQVKSLVSSYS